MQPLIWLPALRVYLGVVNVVVPASWTYSDLMPVISLAGSKVGLSPLLQWIVVPGAAFAIMRRVTNQT